MKKNHKRVKSANDYFVDSTILTLSNCNSFVSDLNKELDKLLSFIASSPSDVEVIEIKIYKRSINH